MSVIEVFTVATPSAPSETLAFAANIGLPRIAADMPIPTSHSPSRTCPGAGIAFGQPEHSGALLHARDERSRGERHLPLRIFARLVANAQFDRIHFQGDRELVHRAFQRQQTNRSPGARIEEDTGRSRVVSRCSVKRLGGCIDAARRIGRGFVETLPGVLLEPGSMLDRGHRSVVLRRQPQALDSVGSVRSYVKHLLPRQRELDRSVSPSWLQAARMASASTANFCSNKSTADVAADEPDLLLRDLQVDATVATPRGKHLVGRIEGHASSFQAADGGVRLHHHVASARRV